MGAYGSTSAQTACAAQPAVNRQPEPAYWTRRQRCRLQDSIPVLRLLSIVSCSQQGRRSEGERSANKCSARAANLAGSNEGQAAMKGAFSALRPRVSKCICSPLSCSCNQLGAKFGVEAHVRVCKSPSFAAEGQLQSIPGRAQHMYTSSRHMQLCHPARAELLNDSTSFHAETPQVCCTLQQSRT